MEEKLDSRRQLEHTPNHLHRGVAFLGAMVLAAHSMAPEDDIAEINYFTRLRHILHINGGRGRPPGLTGPGAPEEPLWIALNTWVLDCGWQPSAARGPDGPMKFTNYPLSQSLLRRGDRERLYDDFRNGDLGRDSDRERVSAWFFNRATSFSTRHIRHLAREATTDRYESIAEAVYDVYTSIDWDRTEHSVALRSRRHRLVAGLYRKSDPLLGTATLLLFPRRQYKGISASLRVVRGGEERLLHRDRDGQYRPLWRVSPDGDVAYRIVGDPRITDLYLPSRDFWILTRDRNEDASSAFASRGAPRLGETFLLLCRNDERCERQVSTLRDEGLIDWEGAPTQVPDHGGWVEYSECMVLSARWDGIIPQMPALFDELRPRTSATISFKGGLKPGGGDSWLEGYIPKLVVTSFDSSCQVKITDLSKSYSEPIVEGAVGTNEPIALPSLVCGDYLVQVFGSTGDSADRRHIKVTSWDSLEATVPDNTFWTPVGTCILRGALLTERCDIFAREC